MESAMDLITRDLAKESERRNPTQATGAPAAKRNFSEAVSLGIAAGNINFARKSTVPVFYVDIQATGWSSLRHR